MGMWTETQGEQRPSGEDGWFLGPPRITIIGGQTASTPWAATCDGPSLTLDMAWPEMASLVHARTDPCCGRRLACWMSAPDGPLASFWLESARQGRSQGSRAQCGSREVRVNARLTKEGKAARYVGQELLVWLVMLCPTPSISRLPQTGAGPGWPGLIWGQVGVV